MQRHKLLMLSVLGFSLVAFACNDDGGEEGAGTDTETETGDGDGDPGDGDGAPGDGDGAPGDGDGAPGDGDGAPGDGDGAPPPDPFIFAANAADEYTRVDRMGMPAIATAVIASKDEYNAANPLDDVNGDFVGEITASLQAIHGLLDDDILAANLEPCAVADCLAQGAPLIVPDTIKINLEADAGFPNGRMLADPVMDVTLAVVLLDLSDPNQDALTLVGLSQSSNDVEFLTEFPFLAPPN